MGKIEKKEPDRVLASKRPCESICRPSDSWYTKSQVAREEKKKRKREKKEEKLPGTDASHCGQRERREKSGEPEEG